MLKEIRPSCHKLIQQYLLLNDIAELFERDFDEYISCPACKSKDNKYKFKKYELNFQQCNNCQTIFMSPRPSQDSMNQYYKTSRNYDYWAKNIFPQSAKARKEKICKPSLERIKKTLKDIFNFKKSSVLEIGPGFGIFAELCTKEKIFNRYDVIEPTPSLAKHCREIGLSVFEQSIESFKKDISYDLIFAFEVLEHIYEPNNFLKKCNTLLKKNGILVISCPNGIGFDTKMLGAYSPSVDNEHVNLFSPQGIKEIFETSGFKILKLMTPGKMDVEIVKEFISENPGILNSEKELNTLLKEVDNSVEDLQEQIANRNESGHMWAFGQKNNSYK